MAGGMVYVIFLTVFLFSYKNKESSLDFMHALPIRRERLLSHALVAGLIYIAVPLAITAIILFFERYFLAFNISTMDIIEWFFYSLFVLFVVFAFSVFSGFLVNSGFVHLQLVIIIFFLPVIFWGLNVTVADTLFEGVSTTSSTGNGNDLLSVVVNNTFPIFAVQQMMDGVILWKTIVWLILALVFIMLSYFLYGRNRNENVHSTFNHLWVRNMLVAFLSISGMLIVGLIISFTLPDGLFIFVLSFLIGTTFAYIVVEMSFQGTVRIQREKGSLITTTIALIIFWIIFIVGWNQYVSYVPDEAEIEGVSLNSSWNSSYSSYGGSGGQMKEEYLYISDTEVIEEATQLHREAVEGPSLKNSIEDSDWVEISYRMSDGSHINRRFDNLTAGSAPYQDILTKVNNGKYAKNYDVLYNIESPSEVRLVEITTSGGYIPIEEGAAFVEEYQRAAHQIDEGIPIYMGIGNFSLLSANVEFDNEFYNGNVSIYNPVLLNAINEEQSITSFLNVRNSEEMFVISLGENDKNEFFEDYQKIEPEALITKYDLEEVTGEEKSEILNAIDQGRLNEKGNRILMFHSDAKEWIEPGNAAPTASQEYNIIGIE
ncbi:hypothetical protein [Salinicoccus luteus]|uniref:hypothetical protein n=1 Tax=Salinicoccus luteus TaxID=367840 RepID=UPI0012EC4AF7|nr:hypothetical protein [Salinicoccus luteus]